MKKIIILILLVQTIIINIKAYEVNNIAAILKDIENPKVVENLFTLYQKELYTSSDLIELDATLDATTRKIYSKLSFKLIEEIEININNNNYVNAIDLIHKLFLISYFSGMQYLIQEKAIILSYNLFNKLDCSNQEQQQLISILKQLMILPDAQNYRQTQTNYLGQEMEFFANKLLRNYFVFTVMKVRVTTKNFDELRFDFCKEIQKMSEILKFNDSYFDCVKQNGYIHFYWLIPNPFNLLYADEKTTIIKY